MFAPNDTRRRTPLVVVIAGPNGAGKSTTAPRLLQGALPVNEFVNADVIARGLSAFKPESVAVAAGRMMLARLQALAEQRADFAFETTLAGRAFAPWLQELRAAGYRAHLVSLSLPSADMPAARVAAGVQHGGHHVAEAVVRRRYCAGLKNFFTLYRDVVDAWELYNDSEAESLRLVASGQSGREPMIYDLAAWNHLVREAQ